MSELVEVAPEEWDGLLDGLGLGDVYFRREYLESAELLGQGRPVYLHVGSVTGDVVFPALVREAPEGFADVGTPMGYGGPLIAGRHPPEDEFFGSYETWCADNRIVATFVRFHPPLANHLVPGSRHWHSELIGASIAWRLWGADPDHVFAGMDAHHRRLVRKARAAGVRVELEPGHRDLTTFVALYEDTMRRREASEFYFFPGAYWRHLGGPLGDTLVRADAALDGELVASIICFASPPFLHYHLGASSERGQSLGANHLLFYETACWASARGFSHFHLGGGVGGFRDSLFDFKRRFDSGGRLPALLGKAVHDEDAYRRLAGVTEVDYAGYFPAYRRPPHA